MKPAGTYYLLIGERSEIPECADEAWECRWTDAPWGIMDTFAEEFADLYPGGGLTP